MNPFMMFDYLHKRALGWFFGNDINSMDKSRQRKSGLKYKYQTLLVRRKKEPQI